MQRVFSALQNVMQQEVDEYTRMLALADEKKDALIKNDTGMLDLVVAKEWAVLKTIKQLEAQRESLIERAEALCHRPKGSMRLSDMISIVRDDMRSDFIRIKSELSELVLNLKGKNAANKVLVETHLQYATFCVNLLSGSLNASLNTYSNSGEMNDGQEQSTLKIDQSV